MTIEESAKQYVDAQLATMRKYDSAPDLSEAEYRAVIAEVVETIERLRGEAAAKKKAKGKWRSDGQNQAGTRNTHAEP